MTTFNAKCHGCKALQPRCVRVRLLRTTPAVTYLVPLCELCRKLPEFKGRFRIVREESGR